MSEPKYNFTETTRFLNEEILSLEDFIKEVYDSALNLTKIEVVDESLRFRYIVDAQVTSLLILDFLKTIKQEKYKIIQSKWKHPGGKQACGVFRSCL